MKRAHAILVFAACAVLAALAWIVWRSATRTAGALEPDDARALAAPGAERLAALDSAETHAAPAVEPQPAGTREALEVRSVRTRSASITVHPPKVASENRGMLIVWCYLEGSHASVEPAEIALVSPEGRELRQTTAKERGTFRDLAPGLYSVIVRDARFEEVRVDSVATGSHVLVDLIGTSRVRLHAFDAETGAQIAASAVRLLDFGLEEGLPPDDEGWFTGLPGGDLKLRVAARGYGVARLEAPGLLPGESREVELRFARAAGIHGVVLATDGTPQRDAQVVLESMKGGEGSDSLRIVIGQGTAQRLFMPVHCDAQGRFDFKGLPFGEYRVQARAGGPFDSKPQSVTLTASERVVEVVLRVAATCSLTGTLTCTSSGAPLPQFDAAFIQLQPLGEEAGIPGMTSIRPNGSFAIANRLPIARVQVLLLLHPRGSARKLGELDLHAGVNECSFDISEFLAGSATVEILATGIEIDGGELLVAGREDGSGLESFHFTGRTGTVGPFPAGDFWLLARGEDWFSATPVPFRIERGLTASVRLELKLVRGRVVVQDFEGKPLSAGTRLNVRRSAPDWPGSGVSIRPETEDGGVLELALEPGHYSLSPEQSFANVRIENCAFEWTAAGPAQPLLRLPGEH